MKHFFTQNAGIAAGLLFAMITLCPCFHASGKGKTDAGISSITSPAATICAGTYNVSVNLKDFGYDTLKSATINWMVGSSLQSSYSFSGTLKPDSLKNISLGNYAFASGVATSASVVIKVWTSSPNGKTDSFPNNDTVSLKVTVNFLPYATVGSPKTICPGKSASLGTAPYPWSSYSWGSRPAGFSSSSSGPTVTPTVTTTYILTETVTATGCSKTDSVTITVTSVPPVPAGSPKTICAGDSVQIGATAVSGYTYAWTTRSSGFTSTASNPVVKPSSTAYFNLTITISSGGCKATDSVLVTVNTLPAANTGGPASVCAGQGITLGAAAVAGNTYTWKSRPAGFNATTSNPSVTPSATATYILTEKVTATGCSKTDSAVITVNSLPLATTGGPQTVCAGDSFLLGTTAATGVSYAWTSNTGGLKSLKAEPRFAIDTTTWFYLTATSSNGCKASDSVEITATPAAKAYVGKGTTICSGSAVLLGDASGTSGSSYNWASNPPGLTSSSSGVTVSPFSDTWYYLTETNAQGCSRSDSVLVKVNATPGAFAGADQKICPGTAVTLGGPSSPDNSYSWGSLPFGFSSSSANPKVSPKSSTTYTLTETVKATGCSNSHAVVITVLSRPVPSSITPLTRACTGRSSYYLPSSASSGQFFMFRLDSGGAASGASFTQNNDTAIIRWTKTGSATLWLVTENLAGCQDSSKLSISANTSPSAAYTATTVCAGTATEYINSSKGADTSSWVFGDGDTLNAAQAKHLYKAAGIYKTLLKIENSNGCTDTVSHAIAVNVMPVPSFTSKSVVCEGSSAAFTNTSTPAGGNSTWKLNDSTVSAQTNASIIMNKKGSVTVTLVQKTVQGCTDSISKTINIIPLPVADFTVKQETGRNYAFHANDTGLKSYLWAFGDTTAGDTGQAVTHSYNHDGLHKVKLTVTSKTGGCMAIKDSDLSVSENGIAVPVNKTGLFSIYPNPANGKFLLSYILSGNESPELLITDISGKTVYSAAPGLQPAGKHIWPVSPGTLIPGLYFVTLKTRDGRSTAKLTLY